MDDLTFQIVQLLGVDRREMVFRFAQDELDDPSFRNILLKREMVFRFAQDVRGDLRTLA